MDGYSRDAVSASEGRQQLVVDPPVDQTAWVVDVCSLRHFSMQAAPTENVRGEESCLLACHTYA